MNHLVVSEEAWVAKRKELLRKEKELTRQSDEVSRLRRELPWTKVEKTYVFHTTEGEKTLSDLFEGRSQLIVYHFMYAPGWEEGCSGCSFLVDHVDGARQHFEHHDVKFCAVSRAPLADFLPFKKRMGWTFDWVSSDGNDFNYDYHVSFREGEKAIYNFEPRERTDEGEGPGTSVFTKDEDGTIYHTYSSYARGGDILIGAHNWLDLTPKGRNEVDGMEWMHLHDEYEKA